MNAPGLPPGTLLLASSKCPFCGSRLDVAPETASSGVKGWRGYCTGARETWEGSRYIEPVCEVRPSVWRENKDEAISAICRRK